MNKLLKFVDTKTNTEVTIDEVFELVDKELAKIKLIPKSFEETYEWNIEGSEAFITFAYNAGIVIMPTDTYAEALSGEALIKAYAAQPGEIFQVHFLDDRRWFEQHALCAGVKVVKVEKHYVRKARQWEDIVTYIKK